MNLPLRPPYTSPAKRDPLGLDTTAGRMLWTIALVLAIWWRGPSFISISWPGETMPLDFFQEWSSATNALSGLPVYDDLNACVKRYLPYQKDSGRYEMVIEVNAHPPASVLLAMPFVSMPYRYARSAWNLVSLAMLVASMALVIRELKLRITAWHIAPIVVLLLLSNPLRQHLTHGQLGLAVLLLLTSAWAAQRRGHPFWTGALLGVATAIKIFPGFFFVYYLLRGRWRPLVGGAIGGVAISLLAWAVLGTRAYEDYVFQVLPEIRGFVSGWANVSIHGLWHKLFFSYGMHGECKPLYRSQTLAQAGALLSALAIVALLAVATWRARSQRAEDHGFALATVAMLLVSPVTWDHYFVLLLLPVTLLWLELRPWCWRLAFYGLFAVLWVGSDWYWYVLIGTRDCFSGVAEPWQTLTALSLHLYALLGLFALGWFVTRDSTSAVRELAPAASQE